MPNALVFLTLFLVVALYFSWQIQWIKNSFLSHAQQHADMVSKIVRLNAAGTLEARQSIEDVLQSLLGSTARFVSYLDMIEPFSADELSAFTRENSLAGISIVRRSSSRELSDVHGPETWLQQISSFSLTSFPKKPLMTHLGREQLYILVWTEPHYPDYIVLGIKDDNIASITESLGLDNIIRTISTVPGIRYVKMTPRKNGESDNAGEDDGNEPNSPVIIHGDGYDIAQAHENIRGMELKVGVDAGHLTDFIEHLTLRFYLFGFCLIVAGTLLSFLLHGYQASTLNRVKQFERELSAQRENATLGKSAAAIAHEIRNPLNSLSMGLQRLTMEDACSSRDHLKLIRQMSEAVQRANGSVTGLLNYARPRVPNMKTVVPKDLVIDIVNLYQPKCFRRKIEVDLDMDYHGTIETDADLMGQVVENIIKNAVEIQPDSGFLFCSVQKRTDQQELMLLFRNGNCPVSPEKAHMILEPYFTTRPDGTGLGMAIANNIVKALHGSIHIQVTEEREISTTILLPLKVTAVGP